VADRVPILAYHAIVEDGRKHLPQEWSAEHAVSLEQFRKQLDLLVAEGWKAILPEPLMQSSLPPKSVVITFDDGHSSDVIAARELNQRGLPAAFFITWSRLGCSSFLSRNQVAELEDRGFEIGSHGWSHVPLAQLRPAELNRHLSFSKQRLEALLGKPVNALAAPFGSYNEKVVTCAIAAGYRRMMTSQFGLAIAGSYQLARLPVDARTTLRNFRALLSGGWFGLTHQRLIHGFRRRILRFHEMGGYALNH
jgi:peptidoglycan/xylan/chitin deacetylase (PgdA/CDA1 family)